MDARRLFAAAAAGWAAGASFARASWAPRPLTSFREGVPDASSPAGARRFWHREHHTFEDGGDMHVSWEVDVDPDAIFALDLEHPETGARLLECDRRRLVIEVPDSQLQHAQKWRHVTASDARHGCGHLQEMDLYHRIRSIDSVVAVEPAHLARSRVVLTTEELSSPSQIFPRLSFTFGWMPAELKDPLDDASTDGEGAPARALFSYGAELPSLIEHSSFTPDTTAEHNSMLNLAIPQQVSRMGWNWDYDANTTRNPMFKYIFPGGVGHMKLFQPYLKAHFGLNMTFNSHISGLMTAPTVNVTGRLKGTADFNADVATAVNFKKDRSASVLDNILDHIPVHGLANITRQETFLRPVKFFFGGTPITVKPGFSCQMKAYHIGLLEGTLRTGLASKVKIDGLMFFDSENGLQTNISAEAHDVRFTPPTWMLFTNRFQLGMMLEPMLWLKGGFGAMKDMEIGFALRPFFNVSIMQQDNTAGTVNEARELAIYPWRAVGLPAGKNYVIKVGANGQYRTTTNQMSTGVAEYADNVEEFSFGIVEEGDLVGAAIEVAIMEDGRDPPVATGSAVCQSVVNGKCSPDPVVARMLVDGKDVEVHLSVVWMENALSILESKIQSVSLRFPTVTISNQDVVKELQDPNVLANSLLRMSRNGRTYSVPLAKKIASSSSFLKSRVVIELGPCFLDSWKSTSLYQPIPSETAPADPTTAKLELLVNDEVVAYGNMPPVQWDMALKQANLDIMSSSIKFSMTPVPAMVPMYYKGQMAGTAEIEIDVMPAEESAFWVFPYQAQAFQEGEAYAFAWTTHGADAGVQYNFTLTAQLVDKDGGLTPTSWQKPVSVACARGEASIHRYHGELKPCVFKVNVSVPTVLVGQRAVLTALWLDADLMPHEMVAPPVSFVGLPGRRLGDTPQWGFESRGSDTEYGVNSKAKAKLDEMRKHCQKKQLKYAFGAGMNFVEHMKNMMMPMGGMPGSEGMTAGIGSAPDWCSEPVELFRLGSEHGKKLSRLFPKAFCQEGACEGLMPGCQQTRINPINIKQIVCKLSRFFRWQQHVGPKMRHIIAYALTLLPSAIQISEKEIATEVAPAALAEHPIISSALGIKTATTSSETSSPAPTTPEPRSTTAAPTLPPTTRRPTTSTTTTERRTRPPTRAPTTRRTTPAPPTRAPTPAPTRPPTTPKPAPRPAPAPTGDGQEQPHWYNSDGSFENIVPYSSAAQGRRLGDRSSGWAGWVGSDEEDEALFEIDGPDALDGEDVGEFDQFTVTIIKPMHYELTEHLLQTILARGGFRGIRDGREDELGAIDVVSVALRDRPDAPREQRPRSALQQAFDLPDFKDLAVARSPGAAGHVADGSALPVAVGAGVATVAFMVGAALVLATVAAAAAARRTGYTAVRAAEPHVFSNEPLREGAA